MATYPNISTFLTEETPAWCNPDLSPRAAQSQTLFDREVQSAGIDDPSDYPYYIDFWQKSSNNLVYKFRIYFEDEAAYNLDFTDLIVEDPDVNYDNDYRFRITDPDDFDPPVRYRLVPIGMSRHGDPLVLQVAYTNWQTGSRIISQTYTNWNNYVTDIYIDESTVPFTINGDTVGVDYLAFTKDIYTLNVVVATTENSRRDAKTIIAEGDPTSNPFTLYTYKTWPYQIQLEWYSPVDGYHFIVPLTAIDRYDQEGTISATYDSTNENWVYTLRASIQHSTGSVAQGVHGLQQSDTLSAEEVGTRQIRPDYSDLTDSRVFYSFKLAWLVQQAQMIKSGVTEQDVFTEIHCKFFYDGEMPLELAQDIVCDFSSLFNSDVDINQEGQTLPGENINDLPGIADDNVYTDHIDLTDPSLTSTGVFNRSYALTAAEINDLCDYLYNANDSIFEELLDGVLSRSSPVEALIDLRLWPFDVAAVTQQSTYEWIKFGRTETTIRGIKLPNNAQAVIDLGSAVVPRHWANFLDYHMSVQLYIPFCGVCELPIDKVLNHRVSVKLICDYVTGAGTAVIFADQIPIMYQQGIIGVSIPMTATNSTEWAKTVMGNIVSSGASLAGGLATGNPSATSRGAGGVLDTATALYSGSHIQQVGASSPQTSLFQPKNCYMVLGIVQPASTSAKVEITEDDTYVWGDTYAKNVGYATFMPLSRIGNIETAGFYCFDNVKADIPEASKTELDQIINLLKTGIFIKPR